VYATFLRQPSARVTRFLKRPTRGARLTSVCGFRPFRELFCRFDALARSPLTRALSTPASPSGFFDRSCPRVLGTTSFVIAASIPLFRRCSFSETFTVFGERDRREKRGVKIRETLKDLSCWRLYHMFEYKCIVVVLRGYNDTFYRLEIESFTLKEN